MKITVEGSRDALAVAAALAVSTTSRLWRQRGLGTAFKWLGRLPGFSAAHCRVEFERECVFDLDVFEPYWGPTVVGGRGYEPEIDYVMGWVSVLRPIIVDCGANFGYWSVVATGPRIGFRGGIAIEANPATYPILERHARLNGGRFIALHRAVDDVSGRTVRLSGTAAHATAYISQSSEGVSVETTTIDDAIARAALPEAPVFLKLDVENYEQQALAGATGTLASRPHLICVEDFLDADFVHVRHLLGRGYELYFVTPGGECRAIKTRDEADAVSRGTPGNAKNFFAARPDDPFAAILRARSSRREGSTT